MAPGYSYHLDSGTCEWPLEEQKALFDLFRHATLPVRLLESCAMLPKMSRTGLYALRIADGTVKAVEEARSKDLPMTQ